MTTTVTLLTSVDIVSRKKSASNWLQECFRWESFVIYLYSIQDFRWFLIPVVCDAENDNFLFNVETLE